MKVLIVLGGSRFYEAVLEPAVKLVKATDAEVHLMTVGEPPPAPPESERVERPDTDPGTRLAGPAYIPLHREPVEIYDQTIERAERELREYLEEKGAIFAGKPVHYKVALSKDAARAIIDYAREEGFDLIAMATHGRFGLTSVVRGSVASAVVRSGVAPVLLVRPTGQVEAQRR